MMTIPLWLFCIICVPALVGCLALARTSWLTIQALRIKRVRAHPLATRQPPGGQPLLDEPPSQCPECQTPYVGVARSDFTPEGTKVILPHTEHFTCENGHKWFGQGQLAVLKRRLAARAKLPVKAEAPAEDDAAAKLAAKVKLLDVDSTKT